MTNTKYLLAVNRAELTEISAAWKSHLEALQGHPCQNEHEAAYWTDMLNAVQTALKEVESDRTTLTGPLNEDLKRVNSLFREARKPLEEFKELASKKLSERALKLEAERQAMLLAANVAAAAGDQLEARTQLIQAAAAPNAKVAGTRVKMGWEYEVTDINQVPGIYVKKVVDAEAMEAYLSNVADGNFPTMPGISFKRVAKTSPNGRNK